MRVCSQRLASLDTGSQGPFVASLRGVVDDVSNTTRMAVDVLGVCHRTKHVGSRVGDGRHPLAFNLSRNGVDLGAEDFRDVFGGVFLIHRAALQSELQREGKVDNATRKHNKNLHNLT